MAAFFEGGAGVRDAGADRLLFATSSMPQLGQYPGLSKTRPSLPHPQGGQTYSAAVGLASVRDPTMPGRPSESTATSGSITAIFLSIEMGSSGLGLPLPRWQARLFLPSYAGYPLNAIDLQGAALLCSEMAVWGGELTGRRCKCGWSLTKFWEIGGHKRQFALPLTGQESKRLLAGLS